MGRRDWDKSLTLNIKSEQNQLSDTQNPVLFVFLSNLSIFKNYNKEFLKSESFCPRLLLGNYVHSYFESPEAHQQFMDENGDKLLAKTGKNKGNLKSDFVIGDKMIASLKDDDGFNHLYHGYPSDEVQKELIVYGEIEGIPVKGKLDSVNLSRGYFVDLKTMKSIYAEEWSAELKKKVPAAVNNILNFGYHGQLGLYRELLKQMTGNDFRPYIAAVSKENVPDRDILKIDDEWLEEGLDKIKSEIVEVWDVIQGRKEPKKCGHCDYCRSQKKLNAVVSLNDLIESDY